jgi:flagellar biosynthetic protein FliR
MGLLLGLALLLVFTVFTLIGDVVSTQLGLSMAVFNDPMNGVSSASIIYQLYFILLALLFFAVDGHLVTVSIIYQSFVYWPIGSGLFYDGLQTIAWSMAWVISAALLIALPIVFCMTLVQFCFGLLNRISPAMNLFSLGFPMAILAGLSLIYLTLPNLAEAYLHLTRDLLDKIGVLLRSSGHV